MSSMDAVRARFARNEGLPFADILTEASIREVLNEHGIQHRDRVYSPVTTIWGFLSQVLTKALASVQGNWSLYHRESIARRRPFGQGLFRTCPRIPHGHSHRGFLCE